MTNQELRNQIEALKAQKAAAAAPAPVAPKAAPVAPTTIPVAPHATAPKTQIGTVKNAKRNQLIALGFVAVNALGFVGFVSNHSEVTNAPVAPAFAELQVAPSTPQAAPVVVNSTTAATSRRDYWFSGTNSGSATYIDSKGKTTTMAITMGNGNSKGTYTSVWADGVEATYMLSGDNTMAFISKDGNGKTDVTYGTWMSDHRGTAFTSKSGSQTIIPTWTPNGVRTLELGLPAETV